MTLYDAYIQCFHCILDVTNRHNILFNWQSKKINTPVIKQYQLEINKMYFPN
jgi:hypothetical protein